MSEEKRRQDCETKALKRLAEKIKKAFPRLPIILLADSLYASEPVMGICRNNGWEFIIWYKTGSIPSITEEYENILEKETSGHAEFVNGIDYNGKPVNMLRFWEEKIIKGALCGRNSSGWQVSELPKGMRKKQQEQEENVER